MKEWRTLVFMRDNRADHFSGVISREIEAHHIVPLSALIKKFNIKTFDDAMNCDPLWDVNNGITMLRTSHIAYHNMWGADPFEGET